MSGTVLDIRRLRAGYGARVVLEDVSLTLQAGEWYVLMGPNGCGKSTLIDCVVGRLAPAGGEVVIGGGKHRLGYACAPDQLPSLLTARQCFEVHAGAKELAAVSADVMEFAEQLRFTPYMESFVDTLSLGTRQKLSVLLCLVGDPSLIVLDESFNGLDPASSLALKRHLRARLTTRGASVLLATHALDIVEHHADRAGLLVDGRIVREWDRAQIEAIRGSGRDFESEMAEPGT